MSDASLPAWPESDRDRLLWWADMMGRRSWWCKTSGDQRRWLAEILKRVAFPYDIAAPSVGQHVRELMRVYAITLEIAVMRSVLDELRLFDHSRVLGHVEHSLGAIRANDWALHVHPKTRRALYVYRPHPTTENGRVRKTPKRRRK